MGLFSKETNYFGLDIGTTSVRLVQLRSSGTKPVLVSYGDVALPAGLAASDSQVDRDKLAVIIKKLVKDSRIATKNVVVGLPSANIFASVITTPKINHAELGKAIKYQADQYIPMALDDVKLDWAVLGDTKDAKEQEVLLVAAPIASTNKYLELVEKSGLEILALEANATASARSLLPVSDVAVIILDLSTASSDLTIVYKNAPRLIRSVPIGTQTLVRAVAQTLGLDDTQAEQFTFRFGLTQTKLEGQVFKAIKPSLDGLVSEVEKSTKFFLSGYKDLKIEKLILTGTGVALPEFTTFIANATGLPVEIGNAWINVTYPAAQQDKLLGLSSQYAVAVGLAERNFI